MQDLKPATRLERWSPKNCCRKLRGMHCTYNGYTIQKNKAFLHCTRKQLHIPRLWHGARDAEPCRAATASGSPAW